MAESETRPDQTSARRYSAAAGKSKVAFPRASSSHRLAGRWTGSSAGGGKDEYTRRR